MSTDRIGIVWNPSKTTREDLENGLEKAVAQAGEPESVTWWETSKDDPGRKAAADAIADGATVVVAAGGDGTVRAVAEELAGTETVLGIVPLGTGNLLARNLGVPLDDIAAALVRALGDGKRTIDLGWVEAEGAERQAFAVMAGFGIDAHMITETDDDLKGKVGWLAYVESLGRAVNASEVIEFEIQTDDADARTVLAHTLLIGNCGMLQGGVTLLPDADPSDGKLDLLMLSAEGVVGWLDTFRSVVWDNGIKRLLGASDAAESGDTTTHGSATSVRVSLPEPRVLEIDGDDVGEVSAFTIELQPAAISVR
jgi:diacylglycerol kinase family enzyme